MRAGWVEENIMIIAAAAEREIKMYLWHRNPGTVHKILCAWWSICTEKKRKAKNLTRVRKLDKDTTDYTLSLNSVSRTIIQTM